MEEHLGFSDFFLPIICLFVFNYAINEATKFGPLIKVFLKYRWYL